MKKYLFLSLFFFFLIPLTHKVWAEDWTVCPTAGAGCSHVGAEGLQAAVDEPSNEGRTTSILIKTGKYALPDGVGTTFSGRMGVTKCFVDLKGKDFILKGEGNPQGEWNGTVLWGKGHEDPVHHSIDRAGICSTGGSVTIIGLHIKEFEGGGLYFSDTKVVITNSVIDGHDHGGIFLIGASSLFAVNNFLLAGGNIMPFDNPSIKAVNNVFYNTKAIVSSINCNDDVPTNLDFVNNIVADIEFTIGINGITTLPPACVGKVNQFKDRNISYNILWKDNRECYVDHEFCDNIKNNLRVDPKLDSPAIDQRGWRHGGNFTPNEGSPVAGSGDPSIPGPKNIGSTGGPCIDGSSTICTQYIQNNAPPEPPPPEPLPNEEEEPEVPQLTSYIPNYIIEGVEDKSKNEGGIFLYILFAVVYIMTIHLAIAIKDQFNIFLMAGIFVFGGILGFFLHSYSLGFAVAIILSLIFW